MALRIDKLQDFFSIYGSDGSNIPENDDARSESIDKGKCTPVPPKAHQLETHTGMSRELSIAHEVEEKDF